MTCIAGVLLFGCVSVASAPDPDAGRIVFGSSFDTTTFAISGITTTAHVGQDVAFVAHFSKSVDSGQIRLSGTLGGATVLNQTIDVTSSWAAYGGTIPGAMLYDSGTLEVRFSDAGNVTLATGTLTVVP